MVLLRFLLVAFNVVVITFLIYNMIDVVQRPPERTKKLIIIIGGLFLLLAPLGIFFGLFTPTFQYFIIYPIAIGLFIYLTKKL